MCFRRFVPLVALAALLAACQPRPQPFRPEVKDGTNRLLWRRDIGGVVVRPVAGLTRKQDEALAKAMIAALEKAEIPAATSGRNKLSLFLDGTATARPGGAVAIDWRLVDTAGRQLGKAHAAGPAGDPAALARRAVPAIATLVFGRPAPDREEAKAAPRALTVWPVVGAPGDGNPALSRAMHDALMAARVPVSDKLTDDGLVIAGSVHVGPPEGDRQPVEILWTVFDSTGAQVAKLAQNNTVPKGALDGKWGPLARMIADSAVPGVLDMLHWLPGRPAPGG